jgi:protease I
MARELAGRRIAILATDGVEEVEYTAPRDAVRLAGGQTDTVSVQSGQIQAMQHLDKGGRYPVDILVEDADPADYDALLLPGGVANPDALRMDPLAVAFARDFIDSGKPIGAICHGPWTLVEADAVRDRTLTSYPSLRTDIVNAGGIWADAMVINDEGLVSSRFPDDLPAFCTKIVEEFAEGRQSVPVIA